MADLILTIHRGSRQIGGTCIELRCEGSRIFLDCGLPLEGLGGVSETGAKAVARRLSVPGLFDEGPPADGILLSHAHPDHSGLIHETDPAVPVYASRMSFKMAMAASIFANLPSIGKAREHAMEPGKPIVIGAFRVTLYPVDHSIAGASAFLIEAAGKRILYTGDLRFHGRKTGMRRALLEACRRDRMDLVITEGTTLSRPPTGKARSEFDLENEGVDLVRRRVGLVLAHFSPLNLDRLVSFFRIAIKTGRIFVLDAYGAYVLLLAASEGVKVPDSRSSSGIRILLPEGIWRTKGGRAIAAHRSRMEARSVELGDLLDAPERFLMLWRPSMTERVFGGALPPGTFCIRSLWKGYLESAEELRLATEFAASGIEQGHLHASGHASRADLVEFLDNINARSIVVVHSERPEALRREFSNVVPVEDGVPISV